MSEGNDGYFVVVGYHSNYCLFPIIIQIFHLSSISQTSNLPLSFHLPAFTPTITIPSSFPHPFPQRHQRQILITANQSMQLQQIILCSSLPSFVRMSAVPNLKYKTTLCQSWLQGTPCFKSTDCYFAHGQQGIRSLQENRNAIAQRNRTTQQEICNYKTVFCKFYARGECRLGDACTFAHERRQKVQRRSIPLEEEHENVYEHYYAYSQLSAWMAQYGLYSSQQTLPLFNTHPYSQEDVSFQQENQPIEALSPTLSKESNETDPSEKLTERSLPMSRERQDDEDLR